MPDRCSLRYGDDGSTVELRWELPDDGDRYYVFAVELASLLGRIQLPRLEHVLSRIVGDIMADDLSERADPADPRGKLVRDFVAAAEALNGYWGESDKRIEADARRIKARGDSVYPPRQ